MNKLLVDLTGKTFGRWFVIKRSKNDKSKRTIWLCKCECGKKVKVNASSLKRGISKSCGCLNKEILSNYFTTHGRSNTLLYGAWYRMKSRCYNINDPKYYRYGARGIKVCDRWLDFNNFLIDMGEKPSINHSIDRKDNDGNYEPDNCRWATPTEQARNRSTSVMTEDEASLIKTYLKYSKFTQVKIAKLFGVKKSMINDIKTGRCWSEVQCLPI